MEIAAWNLQFRFCLCVLKVSPRIKLSCVKEVSFVKLAVWHIFILFVSVVSSYQFENYLFSSKQNKSIFCIHMGYEREKQPGILGLVWCSQPGFTMIRQGHSETIMGQVENKILTISEQRQSHSLSKHPEITHPFPGWWVWLCLFHFELLPLSGWPFFLNMVIKSRRIKLTPEQNCFPRNHPFKPRCSDFSNILCWATLAFSWYIFSSTYWASSPACLRQVCLSAVS